jgi:hypothetical protein
LDILRCVRTIGGRKNSVSRQLLPRNNLAGQIFAIKIIFPARNSLFWWWSARFVTMSEKEK